MSNVVGVAIILGKPANHQLICCSALPNPWWLWSTMGWLRILVVHTSHLEHFDTVQGQFCK